MCVDRVLEGHGSFAEECLRRGRLGLPGARRPDRRRGGRVLDPAPHRRGSGSSIAVDLAAGDWLAVLGAAGGSGIAAVQLGRALGARVIAVVSDDERAEFCRELGADVDDQPPRRTARAGAARRDRRAAAST